MAYDLWFCLNCLIGGGFVIVFVMSSVCFDLFGLLWFVWILGVLHLAVVGC